MKSDNTPERQAGHRRPIIGIPAPVEHASWRVWSGTAHLLSTSYTSHLRRAGATVIVLPVPLEEIFNLDCEAQAIAAGLDGLVLAGGADVAPELYGQEAAPESGPFDTPRDAWESALIAACLDAGVPIFGICRGLQLLNVVLGGTLHQHLPPIVGSDVHNPTVDAFGTHGIRTEAGSWLRGAIHEEAQVATYHHQAIDVLAPGLHVTATAEDGTIEGVEDLARGVVGVQWHPEARENGGVFRSFVKLCEVRRRDGSRQ